MAINNLTIELATSTLNDFENEYPVNPDDIIYNDRNEYGKSGYDLYSEIASDSKCKQVEKIIRDTVLSVSWGISYDTQDYINQDVIDFLTETLSNISNNQLYNIINNLMDARIYGFKVAEKVFKIVNGKYVIDKIKCFKSEYFDFKTDKYSNLEFVYMHRGKPEEIKFTAEEFYQKFILYTYPYLIDNNYYGNSAYYSIYHLWRPKKRLQLIAPIAYELRFIPPIINEYDKSLDEKSKDALKRAVNNVKNYAQIHVPASKDNSGKLQPLANIKVLNTEINNFSDLQNQITAFEKEIARTLLMPDDLGYTTTSVGSNAKSQTQNEVFKNLITTEQSKIEDVLNSQLIKQLIQINFPNEKIFPSFKFFTVDYSGLLDKVGVISGLKSIGVKPTDSFITDMLDIPIDETVEETPSIPNQPVTNIEQNNQDVKMNCGCGKVEHFELTPTKASMSVSGKRVDFQAIDTFYTKMNSGFLRRLTGEFNQARLDLLRQVKKDPYSTELTFKKKNKDKIRDYIYAVGVRSYLQGKQDILDEADKGGQDTTAFRAVKHTIQEYQLEHTGTILFDAFSDDKAQDIIQGFLDKGIKLSKKERAEIAAAKRYSEIFVKQISNEIENEVEMQISLLGTDIADIETQAINIVNGVFEKYSAILNDPEKQFVVPEDALKSKYLETVLRTLTSEYYNTGRFNQQTDPELNGIVVALQYQAILDGRTTYFCMEHDGEIIEIDDPRINQIYPPNHYNCRSLFSSVFRGDEYEANWGTKSQNDKIKQEAYSSPATGFGGVGRVTIPKSLEEVN